MKLYKVTTETPDLLGMHYQEVPLPTEVVVTEAKVVVPRMARVYQPDLYLVDGEAVDYQELVRLRGSDFHGTAHEESVLLWEVHQDNGDDGHWDYRHEGWVYLPTSALDPSKGYPSYFTGVGWPEEIEWP